MKKLIVLVLLLTGFMVVHAQSSGKTTSKTKSPSKTAAKTSTAVAAPAVKTPAKVDAKSKEFIIPSDTKDEFRFYGYQYPNESTKKMICFSSDRYDVAGNIANCPLGSYFNTGGMKVGDRIVYLGKVGNYGKMNYISGSGQKTVIYILKTSFTIK
jgi:hypothetical protein